MKILDVETNTECILDSLQHFKSFGWVPEASQEVPEEKTRPMQFLVTNSNENITSLTEKLILTQAKRANFRFDFEPVMACMTRFSLIVGAFSCNGFH